ncbi:MAG: hypothetical protein CFE49_14110 [Pseudomonas sp. PGPPP3]|nr:MAG: hypothetical protein CFE49_14110 [Pseudomonas sp. PGPPP3]
MGAGLTRNQFHTKATIHIVAFVLAMYPFRQDRPHPSTLLLWRQRFAAQASSTLSTTWWLIG